MSETQQYDSDGSSTTFEVDYLEDSDYEQGTYNLNCDEPMDTNTSDNCNKCGVCIPDEELMAVHRRMHKQDRLKCKECGVQYKSSNQFKVHMEIDGLPYKCYYCDEDFPNVCLLARHSKSHITPIESDTSVYNCLKCYKCFSTAKSLREHQQEHSKDFDKSRVVIRCISKKNIHRNDVSEKSVSVRYVCPDCPMSFGDINDLDAHKQENHRYVKRSRMLIHTCSLCTKRFNTIRALKIHQIEHRKVQTVIRICTVCWETFKTDTELFEHRKTHRTDKADAHTCPKCLDSFTSREALDEHSRLHLVVTDEQTTDVLQCADCSKEFDNADALSNHQKVHLKSSAELAGRYRACAECGQRFCQPHELRAHERLHRKPTSGVRKCPFCPRIFDGDDALNDHKSGHLRIFEKLSIMKSAVTFSCTYCAHTFASMHELTEHKRSHFEPPQAANLGGENFVSEFINFLVNK